MMQPDGQPVPVTWVAMPRPALDKLKRAAAARNLPVKRLAALIVEVVADDDLVNAVLDDAEEPKT